MKAIVVRHAVTIAALTLGVIAASAQTDGAPVTACDTYAANSLDPQRKTTGVNLVELDVARAIPGLRGRRAAISGQRAIDVSARPHPS
jgi:hypothetical protein